MNIKLLFPIYLTLCLCGVGCATLNDVGKQIWSPDSKEGQSTDKQTELVVSPNWTSDPSNPNNVIIEAVIRKAANKPTGELTKADLEKVTKLESFSLYNKQLTSGEGLENLTHLTRLNLQGNKLSDVKGLEKLTQLNELRLNDNPDLTKAQIAELQKVLPKYDIFSNPKK